MVADPNQMTFDEGAGSLPAGLLEVVANRTSAPFVALDRAGVISYVSGSISRFSRWRAADLLGKHMLEILMPDQIDKALASLGEIAKRGPYAQSLPIVFAMMQPDGEPIWCEVGAISLDDIDFDGTLLRLHPWTHHQHFDHFVASLLGAAPLEEVCAHLCRSIAVHLMSTAALIHHGFDGNAFRRTDGASPLAEGLPGDVGPWMDAVRSGELVSVGVDDLPEPTRSAAAAAGVNKVWGIPVPTVDGVQPAALTVWRSDGLDPMLGHGLALERHTRHVQLALQRWAEHQRLVHAAGHDSLTGVANRASFRARMAEALAIGESNLAVAFCDLDDFKSLNDSFGHQTGDRVLIELVDRIRQALRTGDEMARLGGDEFTILLRNIPDLDAAEHIAERLLAAVRAPITVDDQSYDVGLSVGIVLVVGNEGPDELLARADAALYAAKRGGGNQSHVAE